MDIEQQIRRMCSSAAFREEVTDLLTRLCRIDTSPRSDLAALRQNEERTFALIEDALRGVCLEGARIEKQPIPASLEDHPAFTTPYYAARENGRGAPFAAEVYAGRHNLLFLVDRASSPAGNGVAVNAHVDVVAPYISPRAEGDFLSGRGSADDKGNVAGIIAALKILRNLEGQGTALRNKITVMFAIDEETGGNGSLALSTDRSLRGRYDSLLVLECTGNRMYAANRGAVYLKAEAAAVPGGCPDGEVDALLTEAFCYAIRELGFEASKIRREAVHPLFPDRPVYLCPGILGPFGAHPSSICGEVEAVVEGISVDSSMETLRRIVEEGIRTYVGEYGDKTQEVDPLTGKPKVTRHYTLERSADGPIHLRVHGTTGHLGALPKNDPAIMKLAYIGCALCEHRTRGDAPFRLMLHGARGAGRLVFEGAQGFLPTHRIEQVSPRVRQAFLRGLAEYLAVTGRRADSIQCEVSFNKLHNEAFSCSLDSASMQRALQAARAAGTMEEGARITGWNASCDARLFAVEHPTLPVITCGAGRLEAAHSAAECIHVPELLKMIEFTTLFLLKETGSIA